MNSPTTIHTSRTIMWAELERVMDHATISGDYQSALAQNVTGKKSSSGQQKTANYLRKLYGFDLQDPAFRAFAYFWKISESAEKPLLTLVFAVSRDYLLRETIDLVHQVKPGEQLGIGMVEEQVEKYHPNNYSENTRRSIAQNLASSWKKAGFVVGKVKNIRTNPVISYRVACFAFLLGYLNGDRGDFIWNSVPVKSLGLGESRLRELAVECTRMHLMNYQYAGSVTAISFQHLLNQIEAYANENRSADCRV